MRVIFLIGQSTGLQLLLASGRLSVNLLVVVVPAVEWSSAQGHAPCAKAEALAEALGTWTIKHL